MVEYGKSIDIAGDINGDGYDDVLILEPSYPDFNNPTGKLFIYSYQKISGVNDSDNKVVNDFTLYQNYPNPFNPNTNINYTIPNGNFVSITVYDVLGNKIETLVNEYKSAGSYETRFNGENFSSGVYYYQLRSGSRVFTKKMLLIK